ncbi:MAG: DUF2500 domain-containing protein [Lachnospiraceae bacterium]|nr:DUF2500 domain-containing protein [Lachnospiraceae bacterium]
MPIFIIIFFGMLIYIISNWILDSTAPEEQVEAMLIEKRTSAHMDANHAMHTNCILYFDVLGETKKFIVRRSIYKMYVEGQRGTLVFKRKRFVDFIC